MPPPPVAVVIDDHLDPCPVSPLAVADEPGRRHLGVRHAQRPVHLRPVRHRRVEPLRARRRPLGRREPRPFVQPAVHLRAGRAGQDPPPPRHRPPRAHGVPQQARALRVDRVVHERVRRRHPHQGDAELQAPLPRPRRAAHRRHPVPRTAQQELQEEFFHTFNQLHERAVARSSSRPTGRRSRSPSLEDRLRTRFEWGLITDVQPPEFETRLAILRKKAESEHLGGIPPEVLAFIATNISDNIRELEGALIRVAAYSSLNRAELSEEVAAEGARRPPPPTTPRVITPELILDETAKMFGWTVEDICGQEPAATARHRPPDRHVRDARAHRPQLPAHRRGVRRPRPHHRHVRRRQDQAPDDRTSRRSSTRSTSSSHGSASGAVDNAVEPWGQPTTDLGRTTTRPHDRTVGLWTTVDNRRIDQPAPDLRKRGAHPQSTGPTTTTRRSHQFFVGGPSEVPLRA